MAKKQAGMLGIIMGILLLALCAMAIAGAFIDEWTTTTGEAPLVGEQDLGSSSLGEYRDTVPALSGDKIDIDAVTDALKDVEGNLRTVMVVFGYLTAALAAALIVLYLLKMVFNNGFTRLLAGIVAILTMIAGAVLVAVTVEFCKDMSLSIGFIETSVTTTLGMAAYFTSVGAMAGGLAGVIGCARK